MRRGEDTRTTHDRGETQLDLVRLPNDSARALHTVKVAAMFRQQLEKARVRVSRCIPPPT